MFAPTITDFTFVFPFKALSAIAVTLKVFPPYFTVFGIVTFVALSVFKPINDTEVELVTLYLLPLEVNVFPFFAAIVNVFSTLPS